MSIHLLSPLIYIFFVKSFVLILPCPELKLMRSLRKIHNISLSVLSFLMLVGITFGTYSVGKFKSVHDLLCLSYDNNLISYISGYIFLYSKYLEWGDTLFLHLSGKPISMLQYTHHMSTAFLVYLNVHNSISPFSFIFQGLNCFVHIPMYWYFAFPKGVLKKYKKIITQSQIFQHMFCILTILYTKSLSNCQQNPYGLEVGLFLYSMYMFFFSVFYLKSYLKKEN